MSGIGALIGGIAGAIIGTFVGIGPQWGWMLGSTIGGLVTSGEDHQGPRLDDLKVGPVSAYGHAIPRVWGAMRVPGNVIWSTDLIEVSNTEEVGGFFGFGESDVTTFTYEVSCAILFCVGPVQGVRRIWANNRLIYDRSQGTTFAYTTTPDTAYGIIVAFYTGNPAPDDILYGYYRQSFNEGSWETQFTNSNIDAVSYVASDLGRYVHAFTGYFVDPPPGYNPTTGTVTHESDFDTTQISGVTVYTGTESQTADPIIVAEEGHSPAYRGYCYVVLDRLKLTEHFGNRVPTFEAEIVQIGDETLGEMDELGDLSTNGSTADTEGHVDSVGAMDNNGFYYTAVNGSDGGGLYMDVYKIELSSGTVVGTIKQYKPAALPGGYAPYSMCYIPATEELWVQHAVGNICEVFNAVSMTHVTTIVNGTIGGTGGELYGHRLRHWPEGDVVWLLNPHAGFISCINIYTREVIPYTGYTSGIKVTIRQSQLIGTLSDAVPIHKGAVPYMAVICSGEFGSPATCKLYHTSSESALTYTINLPHNDYGNIGGTVAWDEDRETIVIVSNGGRSGQGYVCKVNIATLTATEHNVNVGGWNPSPYNPFAFGAGGIVFSEARDAYYIHGTMAGVTGGTDYFVAEIDPVNLWIDRMIMHDKDINIPWTPSTTTSYGEAFFVDPSNSYRLIGGIDYPHIIPISPPLTPDTIGLDVVVGDICEMAGLEASDINVLQLASVPVRGYAVARQTTARAAIEALQPAYYFDAVESDDKLKFVRRGRAISTTIPEEDRAAREQGTDAPAAVEIVRSMEIEVPNSIEARFADIARNYETNTAYARRLTRDSLQQATLDLPLALFTDEARAMATVNLWLGWQRQTFKWSTNIAYAEYEPTDVVTLTTSAGSYNVRITNKTEHPNGIIDWEGIAEDATIYSQVGLVSTAANYPSTTLLPAGIAILRLLDIPILSDTHDDAGFYAAWCTTGTGDSCVLYRSTDGSTFAVLGALAPESVLGAATSALGDWDGQNVFDYENTVNVTLIEGELESASQLSVLNGENMAVLGDEIIQFQTATLVSGTTYQLSGLLRGRLGTEWAMSEHSAGDRFVLVNSATWSRVPMDESLIGSTRYYKPRMVGASLASAPITSLSNQAVGLKPYRGAHLRGERDGSGNLTITWKRRTRIGGGWRDSVDVSLGETTESYEVDIVSGSPLSVIRTISVSDESASYTAAQQISDFGSTQSAVMVKVYQLNETVGRGYALEGTI